MLLCISLLVFIATLIGGLFAIRLKDQLHLILGFSAGAVIGVAFFDLLPEALSIAATSGVDIAFMLKLTAVGFAGYLLLDRFFFFHSHEDHVHEPIHSHKAETERGILGALSLSVHSLLDGIAIGLSFQVSSSIGMIVAAAVITHDFSDGINTTSMILRHHGSRRTAFLWLVIDAFAPVIGIISTFFLTVSESTLGLILAIFAGFFLYIGASDLVPESFHEHPKRWTTLSTVFGMAVIYIAIRLAGI